MYKAKSPYRPTYAFFLGEALDEVLEQGILRKRKNDVRVGYYSQDIGKIVPVKYTSANKVIGNPEKIIVAPLEDIVNLQSPLVEGRLKINSDNKAPDYGTCVIKIDHPVMENWHIVEDEYSAHGKYGNNWCKFVGTGELFDPIVDGFATFYSYPYLFKPSNLDRNLDLVLALTPETLTYISKMDIDEKFLSRISKLDPRIGGFVQSKKLGQRAKK